MKAGTEEGMTKGTTQDLKRYYGLNAQDYDGVALYIPNDVMSVNELLIIKLKDESQAEQVEAAAKERLKTQKTSFEGYAPSRPSSWKALYWIQRESMSCWSFPKMRTRWPAHFRKVCRGKGTVCYSAVSYFYYHFYQSY